MKAPSRGVLVASSLALLPAALDAQSPTLDRSLPSAAWLEVMRPDLKNQFGASYTSLLINLGLRWRFSDGITLVAEVPYAAANTSAPGFGRQSVIGNIYVGALFNPRGQRFQIELGARPPIAQDDPNTSGARSTAIVGDVDRFEAYLAELFSVRAAMSWRWRPVAAW